MNIPLVIIALDRDVLSEQDDLEHRVAMQPALYKVGESIESEQPVPDNNENEEETDIIPENKEKYEFIVSTDCDNKILLDETGTFVCKLLCNNNEIDTKEIVCVADLLGTEKDSLYFDLIQVNQNTFTIYNKRPYLNNKLLLTFSCETLEGTNYTKEVSVMLGGYY